MSGYTGSWEEAADNWKIRAEEAETQLTEARRLLGLWLDHHGEWAILDLINATRAFLGES